MKLKNNLGSIICLRDLTIKMKDVVKIDSIIYVNFFKAFNKVDVYYFYFIFVLRNCATYIEAFCEFLVTLFNFKIK